MEMAKSTYYFELSKVDLVDERNIQLKEEIQKIFTEHKGRYASCISRTS
jgi:putative transposase